MTSSISCRRDYRATLVFLVFLLLVLFIPWLGLTPFNTKGEPREAIVAVSMLQSGNWILPVSFGADIPYKPPFLAWCIAVLSLPQGHVSEFTSRLPSALAAIALALTLFSFVRRRMADTSSAMLTALIFVSSIEVWRAASACRVDMLLTAFIFGALVALYDWRDRGWRGVPLTALGCMTCAVLTKGPVGALLPALVAGVYGLVRGDRFVSLIVRLSSVTIAAMVIPAIWYAAAFRQGGDEFLRLAMEENFGRLTGTMSYSSHEKGVWYNFATVALGMLPYTLFGLIALATVNWRSFARWREAPASVWRWLRSADAARAFCCVATLTIFIFYCIPKSKRSVYLLPIYPFLAWYALQLVRRVAERRRVAARACCALIGCVSILIGGLTVAGPWLPAGSRLAEAIHAADIPSTGLWMGLVAIAAGVYLSWALWMRRTEWCLRTALGATLVSLTALSAGLLPAVVGAKTDRGVAQDIAAVVSAGPVYSYMEVDLLRYYTVNYYLGDRLRLYERELPEEGYLLVSPDDLESWRRNYDGIYRLNTVYTTDHRSCDRRQPMMLVRFEIALESVP